MARRLPPNATGRVLRKLEERGLLSKMECFWRDHQPWLAERGYLLRPRYSPDWVPSWKGTNKAPSYFEDGQRRPVSLVLVLEYLELTQIT